MQSTNVLTPRAIKQRAGSEATRFGFPIMRVNETYLEEIPWGTLNNAPKANQAANLGV
jgi:hypothetical protein